MKNHTNRLKSFVAIGALLGAMGATAGNAPAGEWRFVGGEPGWVYEPEFRDGRTRSEVLRDLEAFQRKPVSGDWRYVGGEPGWVLDPSASGAGKTRAEVLKELEAFKRSPAARARADDLYGNP